MSTETKTPHFSPGEIQAVYLEVAAELGKAPRPAERVSEHTLFGLRPADVNAEAMLEAEREYEERRLRGEDPGDLHNLWLTHVARLNALCLRGAAR